MPEDQKVRVDPWLLPPRQPKDRVLADAFLVEGEPLDGASGSPVFVRRTFPINVVPKSSKTGKFNEATVEGSIWCLGLLSDVFTAKPGVDYDDRIQGLLPRGVNVVVPPMKIREVLDHPRLAAARNARQEAMQAAKTPMKASAPSTTPDIVEVN